MNIAARITELRAERTRLRAEAFEFLDSPGKWSECHNAAYKKDMAKLEANYKELSGAIDTLLDMSGCESSSSRVKAIRAERKKLESKLQKLMDDNPKPTNRQRKTFDDGVAKLKVIDKEVYRITDVLIATQPPSGLLVL